MAHIPSAGVASKESAMWTLVIGLCVFLAVRAVSKMLRNAQARRWVAE
jgi:hypothetical protein